jgi:hypothetical protein
MVSRRKFDLAKSLHDLIVCKYSAVCGSPLSRFCVTDYVDSSAVCHLRPWPPRIGKIRYHVSQKCGVWFFVRAFAYPSHGYTPLTCLLTAEGRDIIEALGQLWHELQGIDVFQR